MNEPEFALENTATSVGRMTLADTMVNNKLKAFNVDLSATSPLGLLASNPANLVNALSTLFLHAQMDPNTNTAITSEVASITDPAQRVRVAAFLVVTSPEYKIMH